MSLSENIPEQKIGKKILIVQNGMYISQNGWYNRIREFVLDVLLKNRRQRRGK